MLNPPSKTSFTGYLDSHTTYYICPPSLAHFSVCRKHHPKAQQEDTQPAKIDLNTKSLPKQKMIQNFTINAQGYRKTKNENPLAWEMGVTS